MENPSADQIEQIILRVTDGFFEEPEISQELRVVVRIATEFRDFLERQGAEPDASQISYAMGTIQSGIDQFVLFGYSCRSFKGLEESWEPNTQIPMDFAETKTAFRSYFEVLTRETSSPVERLASLLSLIRIQLIFLAYFFPWGEKPNMQDAS